MAERLTTKTSGYEPYTPSDPETLARTLRPGDILLIEGNQKVSAAIKYLTQSTWSHAAFFAGDEIPLTLDEATLPVIDRPQLIEVNIGEGCVAVPLRKYSTFNTRICRPIGLTPDDRDTVAVLHDLPARHEIRHEEYSGHAALFHAGTAGPVRWRRRLLAFGSGDPTRAICSTLIAEAFEQIRYPILPEITRAPGRASATSTIHAKKSCIFAIIRSIRRAISIFLRISRSSSRRSNSASTTSGCAGTSLAGENRS